MWAESLDTQNQFSLEWELDNNGHDVTNSRGWGLEVTGALGSVSRVNGKEECAQTQGGPGIDMVALPSITMVREEAMGMASCQPCAAFAGHF